MSGALSSAACGTGNSTASAGSGAASGCARAVAEQRLPAIPGGAVALVPAAVRGTFDYTDVRTLVTVVTGQILGLSLEP
jgi:hypothetical protein